MTPTTTYKFGDIVLARFPFTNQEEFKQRPAVVVSSAEYNEARPDVVLMAISSQVRDNMVFGAVKIMEWQAANLIKPSLVKPVFATIEQELVKLFSRLHPQDIAELRKALTTILG